MVPYPRNIRLRGFPWIGVLWFGVMISAIGQDNQIPAQAGKLDAGLTIQVGVEEVRLDAVVLDKKGRQITDMTADDFEIYQDGQPQKINSSTYVAENQIQPGNKSIASQDFKKAPPIPVPALTRDAVRRTIVFLVDDLSMSFPDVYNARMALQKFVETQMQPGDLVSIVQTKGGNAGLQTFSSDKRELFARIGNIRWSLSYPSGIRQIMAIDYCIKALQEMPGRKFLLLLSSEVMVPGDEDAASRALNFVADSALRAGVVIHTLDILGVINNQVTAQMTLDGNMARDQYGNVIVRALDAESTYWHDNIFHETTSAEQRLKQAEDRIKLRPNPLSRKTGGFFLTGNNFFLNGIGDVDEQMKGYYLLSYTPPANTFNSDNPTVYHKIKITVKRPGSEVHTRDGFFGRPGNLNLPTKSGKSLMPILEAMFSPFKYSDLKLDLASGYIDDPPNGYLLRAWLHLDGHRLSFVDEKDGSHSVSLLAMATTSDVNGSVQDSGAMRIGFPVSIKDIQWIRENGLRFSLSLPAKKPGEYYVRVAVKDQASSAIGSAYQFMEIPDLKKGRLSLSSIFILNRAEDASWIQSGTAEESQGQPNSSQQAARRSQALRSYLPGESFDYMAIIYNAQAGEGLPDLESRFVLYRNGIGVFKSKPEPVDVRNVQDFRKIPINNKLKLDNTLRPGDYVFQLQVLDKRTQEKNIATQALDFKVDAKPGSVASKDQFPQGEPVEKKSKTVVEMTSKELLRSYHVLGSVKFDSSQDHLEEILHRVGDNVLTFFRTFVNTSSKEQVRMSRTLKDTSGFTPVRYFKPEGRWEDYQYLILSGSGSLIEDRTDKRNRPVNQIPGFMMSSGYAGLSMYFHPTHQSNSHFRYIGRAHDLRHAHVIAFAQKPESGDYLAYILDPVLSVTIRFLVQGFIWVDPDTYQIMRMYTKMLLPERDTTLQDTFADIVYNKIHFDRTEQAFWLPKDVSISWDFPDVEYYNHHAYSDYHLFTVGSDYKITLPETDK